MARSARRIILISFFVINTLPLLGESKSLDPYKVLGVDKSASQRDIQKAFHKLSLKYHPDKNKAKGAQEKFAELNNAYEILSDEEKRKKYDLYGNETPNPGFDTSNFGNGNHNGYTYFTSGSGFRPDPSGWQSMGGQPNSKTFSFSFGGGPNSNSQFGFGDIFSNFFNGGMNNGFDSSTGFGSKSKPNSPNEIVDITTQYFNKQINNQGMTWLLLFYTPNMRQYYALETLVEELATSLNGAIKVGKINCLNEKSLCQKAGLTGLKSAKLFIYSYTLSDKGSLVEYTGDYDSKSLKIFIQEHLPRFSKRVDDINNFIFPKNSIENQNLPQVLLLSTKRDTPLMWRVISGLFRNHFLFYDAQVNDLSNPLLKRLGVTNLPALIGRTVDGQEHLIKSGISIPDLKSGIQELKSMLETFERKNKKVAASYKTKKQPEQEKQESNGVSILTGSNFNDLCGEKVALCIIGVFKSSNSKENLEKILTAMSQKTMVRGQNSISYGLLDGNKNYKFLQSFDRSGYKSYDKFVLAYKPKRGKYAVYKSEFTNEEVEKFVGSVLNGDVQFSSVRQKPVLS